MEVAKKVRILSEVCVQSVQPMDHDKSGRVQKAQVSWGVRGYAPPENFEN